MKAKLQPHKREKKYGLSLELARKLYFGECGIPDRPDGLPEPGRESGERLSP